jgi:hypothetical protein
MNIKIVTLANLILRRRTKTNSILAVGFAVLMAISSILVNPAIAVHTGLALPSTPVILEAFNGTDTYFNISLTNVPSGYDVTNIVYGGWCVDRTAEMMRSPAIHQVRLYSSFNPPGELATQEWDMVNYVLNHKQGNAEDIQEALWYFVNFEDGYIPTSEVALDIVNDTLANGNGFVPRPGQIISIICSPVVLFPPATDVQVTIIEITVPLMIGDVTGPDGQPDGKVDMRDIGSIAYYFGQTVPPAPAKYDITGSTPGVPDGKIDMRDIGTACFHYGERSL